MEISETIKFRDICCMLNRVKNTENKTKKEKIITRYYESFCKHREKFREEQQLKPEMPEDGRSSFYCVLRCLIPNVDLARPPYGLQIPTMGKVYIKVLQLGPESKQAEILEARNFSGIRGDYADKVYRILKPRCSNESSNLTLKEVHDLLDVIATEDRANTEKVLTKLFQIASAEEQMWFVRLLLKSMHLAIADQTIFRLLHHHAKAFYQTCSSLKKLCCSLADNKFTASTLDTSALPSGFPRADLQINITPFEHIKPQLCEVFPGNIENIMATDVLYLEMKMDGERFQLHYKDNCFKYISRNGIDYTASFGASFEEDNTLTAKLKHLLPIGMESMILDGEMMVWDIENQKYREKGENTDVKHLHTDRCWQPCFVVYDLLYWNGQDFLQLPYIQRKHKVKNLLSEQEGVLQIMKSEKVQSLEDFKRLFQQALDQHQEGVVLKKQNAVYRPGCRNGGGWYKVKADYIDGLTTEFDVLVIGGFYNRSRTFVESFLVGVLKYTSHQLFEVYSIGKVSNCTLQRVVLNNHLKGHWHLLSEEKPPLWYHYKEANAEGRPDVWIEPRHSIILQIKATDLNPSGAFALTMSLHFPRIQAWRNDKLWHECLSLEEYNQIRQNSTRSGIKKIVKRNVSLEDFTGDRIKRRKLTPAEKRKLGLESYDKKFIAEKVEKTSGLLEEFSVCVLSASLSKGYTPEYLKSLVVENGGTIVENPLPNNPNCIVVAGDITYRVKSHCKSEKYDIVRMEWLLRICKKQSIKLKPLDMIAMTPALKQRFGEFYDKHGDHYTEFVSGRELKRICDAMDMEREQVPELSDEQITKIENAIYTSNNLNYFRQKFAYFYNLDPDSARAQLHFQWHGGKIINDRILQSADNNADLNGHEALYIFVNVQYLDKMTFCKWLSDRFSSSLSQVEIFSVQWILHSHKARILLDGKEYTWIGFN